MRTAIILSMLLGFFHITSGQTVNNQFVYDFSNNADTQRSEIKWVVAENDFLIVAGNKHHNSDKPTAFVAKVSWSGVVLWQSELAVPTGSAGIDVDGGDNLAKMPDGSYVLGGISKKLIMSDTVGTPFVYRFSNSGTTISYNEYGTSLNKRFGAIMPETDGSLIISALYYHLDTDFPYNDEGRAWIAKLTVSGAIIFEGEVSSILGNAQYIESILMSRTGNRYSLNVSDGRKSISSFPYNDYQFSKTTGESEAVFYFGYDQFSYSGGAAYYQAEGAFQMIQSKQRNARVFVGSAFRGPANIQSGLAYGQYRNDSYTLEDTSSLFGRGDSISGDFRHDRHLSLLEAKNSDIFIGKPVASLRLVPIYDTITMSYSMADSAGKTAAVIRLDTSLNIRSIKYYAKVAGTPDLMYQYINRIAQSPDGSKYALVGNIENFKVHRPMVWDTMGSTSWIVILTEDPLSANTPKLTLENLHIYPNPAKDLVNIDFKQASFAGSCLAVVCDMEGKALLQQALTTKKNNIHIKSLQRGQYLIILYQDGIAIGKEKMIKQ